MPTKKIKYSEVLKRLRSRKLKDEDYELLATELEKVVSATAGGKPAPGGRRIVAQLPFGLDIVK